MIAAGQGEGGSRRQPWWLSATNALIRLIWETQKFGKVDRISDYTSSGLPSRPQRRKARGSVGA